VRKAFNIHRVLIAPYSLLCSLFILSFSLEAQEASVNPFPDPALPPVFPTQVFAQDAVGKCACGPCAIFNSFQFGNASLSNLVSALPGDTCADKVRALIKMYGDKPSVIARDEPRYLAEGGMWDADLVPFINDWLKDSGAPPITGERLILQGNETPQDHMRHVYSELRHSLDAGFPPIINLQSYSEQKSFLHHYWKWMDGHFVTVVAVQATLPADASKFCMWVADSETGHILQVFVNAGEDGPASALSQNQNVRSGKMTAPQPQTYPFLRIQSPRLENILEGHSDPQETICVLQYIAHR
jgi:hypothetical protein